MVRGLPNRGLSVISTTGADFRVVTRMSSTDLPVSTRPTMLAIVRDLLHDWIKYMEMRLLSVDWDDPPDDAKMQLQRGIEETRRFRGESRGVYELWAAGRKALGELPPSAELSTLVTAIDDDVGALVELLDWRPSQIREQSEDIVARIRRPGRRLRSLQQMLATVATDELP